MFNKIFRRIKMKKGVEYIQKGKRLQQLMACLMVVALIAGYIPINASASPADPTVSGAVYGTVTLSDGAAGKTVDVSLTDAVYTNIYTATDNNDGTYSYFFNQVNDGTYTLDITSPGYMNQTVDLSVYNGNTTFADVTLLQEFAVNGFVYDRYDNPIEGALVTLESCSVLTDVYGAYTVHHNNGTFTLNVSKDGYQPGSAVVTINGAPVVVKKMRLYTVDDNVTVSGRIVDDSSTPGIVTGAAVTISGNDVNKSVLTDVYGVFSVGVPGNLTYDLNVAAAGYETLSQTGSVVAGAASQDLGDITVNKVKYTVTGSVYDSNNNPISGAIVTAAGFAPVTTDSNGVYSITLPDGSYTVTVTAAGYQDASVSVTVNGVPAAVNINLSTLISTPTTPPDSSSGSSSGSSGTPDTYTGNTNVTGSDLDQAILNAKTTGKITISAPASDSELRLNADQLTEILQTGKPLEIKIQQVKIAVPATVIKNLAGQGDVQITAETLPDNQANNIISETAGRNSFRLVDKIYELNLTVNGQKLVNFNDNLQISLPVPNKDRPLAAQGKLSVFYFNEAAKEWENLGGKYDAATGSVVFETGHLSKYAVMEVVSKAGFVDVPFGHWAVQDINAMASLGYVKGVAPGQFNPEAGITRAEFTAILVRIMDLKNEVPISFQDVQPDQWFYSSVARAYGAGIVKGIDADRFAPFAQITREQMSVMISNALKIKNGEIEQTKGNVDSLRSFVDSANISDWAKNNVAIAVNAGIVKGITAGGSKFAFDPKANATRAQATVMLKRFVDLR